MDKKTPPEWYLDIVGRKTGPYTTDQVHTHLVEGQLQPHHLITSSRLKGKWITIHEFISTFPRSGVPLQPKAPAPAPTSRPGTASFNMPQRPPEVEERTTGIIMRPSKSTGQPPDPTTSLFDALQAVREKQTSSKIIPPPRDPSFVLVAEPKIPRQVWIIAGGTTLAWFLLWGFWQMLNHKPAPIPVTVTSIHESHPPGSPPAVNPMAVNPPPVPTPQSPPPSAIRPQLLPPRNNVAQSNHSRDSDRDRRDPRDDRDDRRDEDRRNSDQVDRNSENPNRDAENRDRENNPDPSRERDRTLPQSDPNAPSGSANPAETPPHNSPIGQPID